MRKNRFTEEQITMALRQADAGTAVAEICRRLGVSEASFYRWKKRYGSLGVSELRELRQLRDENRKLKGLVADLSLDKTILQEARSEKSGEARAAARTGSVGARRIPGIRASGVSGCRRGTVPHNAITQCARRRPCCAVGSAKSPASGSAPGIANSTCSSDMKAGQSITSESIACIPRKA